jgi:glycosyltransferase involved in cell wall biosynthesis
MLASAALQFSALRKRLVSAIAQREALEAADCFHATSLQEFEEIRAYGLEAPVAIVCPGIDVMPVEATSQLEPSDPRRTVLYLGRVHPKKGLDCLIEAWSRIEMKRPDWRLRIVGPSEGGYGEALKRLVTRLALSRVVFDKGLYGEEKNRAFREAEVFVLPTLNENFAMVVAEALANGTPVISTRGAPWQGLVQNGCGWWIDHGVEPLVFALAEATEMRRSILEDMGSKGRAWMARDFGWERFASNMVAVYRWCAGEGDRPPFMVTDR